MNKHCTGCGKEKPRSEFTVSTNYGGTRERKLCHECCEALLERQRAADQRFRRFAEQLGK